jgi:hypothetical protein
MIGAAMRKKDIALINFVLPFSTWTAAVDAHLRFLLSVYSTSLYQYLTV